MFPVALSMDLKQYKSMGQSRGHFWRFGEFSDVTPFQREDMILFLRECTKSISD